MKGILSGFVSKELSVAADQLAAAHSSHKRTLLAPVALFLCLIGATHSQRTALPLTLVGIGYCLLVALNHRQVARTVALPLSQAAIDTAYRKYFWAFVGHGLLGATLPWLVLYDAPQSSGFALTAIILGYSIGLSFVHSAFPPAVIAFLLPVSTSICAYWIISKPPWVFELVVFQVFFITLVLKSIIAYSGTIRTAIERQYQINLLATRAQESATSLVEALQNLRDANIEKQRIFSAANHDLRQPLSSLSALVTVLDRRIEKLRLDEEGIPIKEVTDKIEHSISVLVKTVDSLGELNQIDSGAIVARPSLFELGPFVKDVVSDFEPLTVGTKVEIRVNIPARFVFSDPLILGRIVRNLIQNALVHAEGSPIECGLGENGEGALCLSVADHGPGIDSSRWEDVLQEYVQLENPERSSKKGFGLGLSIVRRLSKLLNMPLQLAHTAGGGLTVLIDISRQLSVVDTADPLVESPRIVLDDNLDSVRHKFLVVEDEYEVAQSYRLLIEEMGGSVLLFASPMEVLSSEKIGTCTLALIDNWLPGMAGTELAGILKKRYPALQIAIMSGDTVGTAYEEATSLGLKFLAKPVSAADIVDFAKPHSSTHTAVLGGPA